MATCPTCRKKFANETSSCPDDGAALLPDEAFSAADESLKPGAQVRDYRIEKVLGRGSYGEVYAAEHPLIGRRAAVKVLHRKFSSEPQIVSRFIAEARAVNKIRHRNIIDVFDFGQLEDGRQYLIMELLDGETLKDVLRRRKRLPFEEALPILRGVADALDAAHAEGIAHRDLKPDNIFIAKEKDGTIVVKLLDFGVAKLGDDEQVQHKTATGVAMGTPLYMSPEQARGTGAGPAADIYAFGVLVFHTLSGRFPFGGASVVELLAKVITETAPPLSARVPELGTRFDDVVGRMLAKRPEERPARAGQALEELVAAAGHGEDAGDSAALDASWDETVKLSSAEEVFTDETRAALDAFRAKTGTAASSDPVATRVSEVKQTANMEAPPPEAITPPPEALAATQDGTLDAVSRERTAVPAPPRSGRAGLAIGGALLAAALVGGFVMQRGGGDDDPAPATRVEAPSTPERAQPSAESTASAAAAPEPSPASSVGAAPSASSAPATVSPEPPPEPPASQPPAPQPPSAAPQPRPPSVPASPKPAPTPKPGGIDGDIFKRD